MKYIYGPVKSRRLGFSLGVSLTPRKTCNFDCIYCQLGTVKLTISERKEYLKIEDIVQELKAWFKDNPQDAQKLDYVTFSGFGEPTLNTKFSNLVRDIRKITPSKIAVITNASLVNDPGVLRGLLSVDLILPSLDAVIPGIFEKIDRPAPDIKLNEIIEGLIKLRQEFKGKIWLEVMLVRGINDDLEQIKALKVVIDKINPDKIQLNSPVRQPAEKDVLPVAPKKLEEFKAILGDKCEII